MELLRQISEGKEIDSEKLQDLGLTKQSSIILKLRLKGLLTIKKSTLSELNIAYLRNLEFLHEFLKCPGCRGTGTITKSEYDRSEGIIVKVTKTNECTMCRGTGEAKISNHVKDLIKNLSNKTC